jgi:hypothetical protein
MELTPDDPTKQLPLVEGTDYYIEAGRWVFTEEYHLRRGKCCGSGCRHCPYADSKPATREGPPINPK